MVNSRSILLATGLLVLAACGSGATDQGTSPSATEPGAQSDVTAANEPLAAPTAPVDGPEIDEDVTLIPSRLLGVDLAVGDPWTVAVIAPEEVWSAIPDAELDVDNDVLFRFTLGEPGSARSSEACAEGPFEGLAFRETDRRLYPITTPGWQRIPDGGEVACDAVATPHSIFVAVAREALPPGEIELWSSGEDAPNGVAGNVVRIPAGQLRAPDPFVSDVAEFVPGETLAPLDVRNLFRVSTHCGLSRLFVEVNGTQWEVTGGYALDDDGVPLPWTDDVRGEEIDLQIEFVDDDRLLVSSLGSNVQVDYYRASDELGCA